jgi:hypothetical protein
VYFLSPYRRLVDSRVNTDNLGRYEHPWGFMTTEEIMGPMWLAACTLLHRLRASMVARHQVPGQ